MVPPGGYHFLDHSLLQLINNKPSYGTKSEFPNGRLPPFLGSITVIYATQFRDQCCRMVRRTCPVRSVLHSIVRANEEIACKAATGVAALIHPQSVECFAISFGWIKSVGP